MKLSNEKEICDKPGQVQTLMNSLKTKIIASSILPLHESFMQVYLNHYLIITAIFSLFFFTIESLTMNKIPCFLPKLNSFTGPSMHTKAISDFFLPTSSHQQRARHWFLHVPEHLNPHA